MSKPGSWPALGRFFSLLLLACLACNVGLDFPGDDPLVRAATEDAWYEIYFTDPTCPPQAERTGGVDAIIAADLAAAASSIDVAAFDLDAEPIVNALIASRERGVVVRVVTDDQNEQLASIDHLRTNGIDVLPDTRSALMHNKFIVIDGRYVWTGSLNYTSNGAYCNNNNAVRFDSPELAANYQAEMDEMILQRSFGPTSPDSVPYPRLLVNETLIETYFGPEERIAPIVAERVAQAEEEILFLAFSFTEETIGSAMLERAAAGVAVRGVFERVGSQTSFSYFPVMDGSPLPQLQVRQDGNPRAMHHKVVVVDRQLVIVGSLNFSANANDSNDENVVIVTDPQFAGYFVEEFNFVWDEAQP